MAEKAPATPPPIPLTPSNVIGIIQRDCLDLSLYLNQDPLAVSPEGMKRHLSSMYAWVEQLEAMQAALAGADKPGAEARAN